MKKISLLFAAVLLTAMAFAQTATPTTAPAPATPTEKAQMKDLRKDVRAYDNKKAEAK